MTLPLKKESWLQAAASGKSTTKIVRDRNKSFCFIVVPSLVAGDSGQRCRKQCQLSQEDSSPESAFDEETKGRIVPIDFKQHGRSVESELVNFSCEPASNGLVLIN